MKNVMTIAWEIAKEAVAKFGGKVKEYFAMSLRLAWAQIKKGANGMENKIAKLKEMGANEWKKGGMNRLYLNDAASELIGLEIDRYNGGRIRLAILNGEKISNAAGGRVIGAFDKSYIDLDTSELHFSPYSDDPEDVRPLLVEAIEKL